MSPLYPPIAEITENPFDKVIAVNFKGPFRLGARVATHMQAADGGWIIIVNIPAALRPTPHEVPYRRRSQESRT
jgi:NAD(P)-dependent dehydrogenase (short-subunit alcohol dehydrogenase family)